MVLPLIFTDLDGSLLDHYTYDCDAARPLLAALANAGIPVIPTTSKTSKELLAFRHQIRHQEPFIIENGAAVIIPVDYFADQPVDTHEVDGFWVKTFVEDRSHWQQLIRQADADNHYRYTTFADAGPDGVAHMTGLSPEAAVLAAERRYGEPLLWQDSQSALDEFVSRLHQHGANTLQGGRFLHVSGQCDKGQAMIWLQSVFQHFHSGQATTTIAIGDSNNDLAMLNAADQAIVIHSPVHPPLALNNPHCYVTQATAPQGWVEGVCAVLKPLRVELTVDDTPAHITERR